MHLPALFARPSKRPLPSPRNARAGLTVEKFPVPSLPPSTSRAPASPIRRWKLGKFVGEREKNLRKRKLRLDRTRKRQEPRAERWSCQRHETRPISQPHPRKPQSSLALQNGLDFRDLPPALYLHICSARIILFAPRPHAFQLDTLPGSSSLDAPHTVLQWVERSRGGYRHSYLRGPPAVQRWIAQPLPTETTHQPERDDRDPSQIPDTNPRTR